MLQSSAGRCGVLKLVGLCFVVLFEWWRRVSTLGVAAGGGEGVDLVERGTLGN